MIQQLRKVNLLAMSAMLLTFSASLALVTLITPHTTRAAKRHRLNTSSLKSRQSSSSNPFYGPFESRSDLFRFQPDSPMGFGMSGSTNRYGDLLQVINRSNRIVRVVAVGYRSETSPELDHRPSIHGVWRYLALESGDSLVTLVPTDSVELWIDFVEFYDGSTWGPNEMKSQETVDAARAALQQASLRFTKILQKRGPDALAASIWKVKIASHSQMHDRKWKEDFDSTVESVRSQLGEAKSDVSRQFEDNAERSAALRRKFRAILNQFAEVANPGLPAPDSPPSK